MVTCREFDNAQSLAAVLVHPVQALRVSTHELLGVKPFKDGTPPKTARLLKRLKKVEALPVADRAVLKLVDALLETRRRAGR
jgi:hypothetical protein